MNKKALMLNKLTVAVLILALLLVFIFFLVKVRVGLVKIVEDSECKSSIVTHAMLLKTTGNAAITDIYCPTKYYTLPGKSGEETKHYVAEALKTCWGTWGKGGLQLFKDEGFYCHICSVIDFNDKSNKIKGLNNYLINTPIKKDEDLTYMDYLGGYASQKADPKLIKEIQEKGFSDTIDTSETYATIFVYAKGESAIKTMLDNIAEISGLLGTPGGGAAGGLVLGVGTAALLGLSFTPAVIVTGTLTVGGLILGYASADDVEWVSLTLFSEYDAPTLKKIGCEISPAKQDRGEY